MQKTFLPFSSFLLEEGGPWRDGNMKGNAFVFLILKIAAQIITHSGYFWLIDDRLYRAILRSLEQTHCARRWFYMSDWLFIARFWISTEVVYLQRWHGWCHMKLQPSRRKFCVHHTTMHHVTSCKATYVRCMRVLAVTCHLHFWQNDRDLLRATAVTRGWNGYRNKSQHSD